LNDAPLFLEDLPNNPNNTQVKDLAKSERTGLLEYSRSIGDQKISQELISGRKRAGYTLQDKLARIRREMDKYQREYIVNLRLYNAEIRFQPLPGSIYYLYETPKDWVSLLGPTDWVRDGYVGGFRYNWDGTWEEIIE